MEKKSAKISRRRFLQHCTVYGIVVAGFGLGPVIKRKRKVYSFSRPVMGTIGEIKIVHSSPKKAASLAERGFQILSEVENRLTKFSSTSEIGQINLKAAKERVPVSKETGTLLKEAQHWTRVTGGSFDPALGRLVQLWNLESKKVPEEREIEKYLGISCSKDLEILFQKDSAQIRFLHPELSLDLGGIGKGYGVDQVMEFMKNEGVEQGLINIGGEIGAFGEKGWKVGIRNPRNPKKIIHAFTLQNACCATSGNYYQYFFGPHHRLYHHLIHPEKGIPEPKFFQSLTIVHPRATVADALSTGLFFKTPREGKRILEENTERGKLYYFV